jgi:serine/threonine-protein kinase
MPSRALPATPRLTGYEILGLLGRGGMGVVYKARQLALNRLVALKMILAGLQEDPHGIARFRIEAEAVARLQHPNIVQIYEVGEQEGRPYVALELVDGVSLEDQVADAPLPAHQAAQLVETLARAMHAAHQRNIVHRDLKPANVLLTADGVPKITDFGLAKRLDVPKGQTRSGVIVGTPSYMPPEQAAGKTGEIGPAADVYALGAILYEVLTGRPPFMAETPLDTVLQVLHDDPVAPTRLQSKVPRDLETICLKCLEKERRGRYASAEDLAEDLARFQRGEPIRARPASIWERGSKWAKRRPAVAALTALVVLVAALGFGLVFWQWRKTQAALHQEEIARADAEENEQKALEQRDKAHGRFRLAREAVDTFFTHVSESPEMKAQGVEKLRTQLLETASAFYQRFVREEEDDVEVQAERGRAYWRLANLYRITNHYDRAEKAYRDARDILQPLVAAYPEVPTYQQDLAHSYHNLGVLYTETNRLAEAETVLRQALDLCQKLAAGYPQVAAYQLDVTLSQNSLSVLYQKLGRTEAAVAASREVIAVRERLAAQHPEDPLYQHDLAVSHNNLGYLYQNMGRPEPAVKTFQEAQDILHRLVAGHRDMIEYEETLAITQNNLGNAYQMTGSLGNAEKAYHEAQATSRPLAATHPEVPKYQLQLAQVSNNLAILYQKTRRPELAVKAYDEGRAAVQRLASTNPRVPAYQEQLAGNYNNLGVLYRDTGHLDQAEENFREAIHVRRRLAATYPDVLPYAVSLGKSYRILGDLLGDTDKPQAALDWFAQGVETLQSVLKKQPKNSTAREYLCEVYAGRAAALSKLGRSKESVADWEQALALDNGENQMEFRAGRAEAQASGGEHARAWAEVNELTRGKSVAPEFFYPLARVCSLAAAAARRDPKLSPTEREKQIEQYAARAVGLLAQAHTAGYFKDAAKLEAMKKDKDLDPLRDRADFKKLLGELGPKAK